MQTHFTDFQLRDPHIADANQILRKCVHCGFCTATCPTYVLGGDELDSPRGRIYLIKNMLEKGEPATAETVKHVDRCLSCLACMSTCPSGVNYMHLVDQARVHIEQTYRRPWIDRLQRAVLAQVMPRPSLFRLALIAARLAKPLRPVFEALGAARFAALLGVVPSRLASPLAMGKPGTYPAATSTKGRVALLQGCVQSVLDPAINAATIRLLTRLGYEVVVTREACCGSIPHHMGREKDALERARAAIDQWQAADVEHIIITASGCGVTIKDYGHMLRLDPAYAEMAKAISAKTLDISEFLAALELPPAQKALRVAYHSACTLQHGQQLKTQPQKLLRNAGFEVMEVPEGHLCCGSAGTYNILQPNIAAQLRDRKVANILSVKPQIIATGNIGCINQLSGATEIPVLHMVELLDWAYGGPTPEKIANQL
ncbi:MAG: glycolate oxidase subunit GlcF [Alphaproteobacteria bacterium]|nr:glycolate oxidase subunit GlcF [Alphaproteobacteria bacterium]